MMEDFEGIDTRTTRTGVADKKMNWCDGMMPIAARNLRCLPGVGPRLWRCTDSDPSTSIVHYDFANIGANPIMIAFLSDGSIWQVNTATGIPTNIAGGGLIINPSVLTIGMCQWGSQYVIIVSTQTNGYWIWDGTTLFFPSGPAPGGGTMPTGVSGSSVETYQGRVWVQNGPSFVFSAPGSFTDFTTGSGGGSTTSADPFLRVKYSRFKQTNGFLYLVGDSSINYISGVNTGGSPVTTTFNNLNADPEVGTPYPQAVETFGRALVIANNIGVYTLSGGAATKISDDLDGVYRSVPNFSSLQPSSAKAVIYGQKIYILLIPIVDPITFQTVNKLFLWNGKFWWTSGQDFSLGLVRSQEINSILTAWGATPANSPTDIYPLFQNASNHFTKTVRSKLWSNVGPLQYQVEKTVTRFWGLAQAYDLLDRDINLAVDNGINSYQTVVPVNPLTISWTNSSGGAISWTNSGGQPLNWFGAAGSILQLQATAIGQHGILNGMTLQTNAKDIALISAMLQPDSYAYLG